MVSVVVFAVIVSIVLFLTSFTGFLVFLTSACIGILAQRWDQRRACMSVLIVPVLITFLGGLGIFM
jgi:TctA family transporter